MARRAATSTPRSCPRAPRRCQASCLDTPTWTRTRARARGRGWATWSSRTPATSPSWGRTCPEESSCEGSSSARKWVSGA
eukprot:11526051-Alexandrium_andersonii.AAC.1